MLWNLYRTDFCEYASKYVKNSWEFEDTIKEQYRVHSQGLLFFWKKHDKLNIMNLVSVKI